MTIPLVPAGEHRLPVWPWLLAALAIAGGMAFLMWRNRQRHAFAGAGDFDRFVTPEPTPPQSRAPPAAPRAHDPPPAPPPASPEPKPPLSSGIVSSRLRPWLELAVQPSRCIVEDHQVTIEFDLELFNSGSAPARGVLVEATLFNAGPAQEQEIGAFMANPVGQGDRIDLLGPLQRMSFKSQVVARRESLQLFDVAGRQVFVPLIAFNALYRWSGGDGQTSISWLVGREGNGEKLAPFRADLGPRVFRGLAARLLPTGLRR